MDNRPIGFFDSGLGGLTTIPYLAKHLPEEKIVYFGDTARTPYGSKAVNTIRHFSMQIAEFLKSQNVKMIVIACNTVTSTCLQLLRDKYKDIPIIGIIDPAAKKVAECCDKSNHIGIIGTKATISNKAYNNAIDHYKPDLNIFSQACPIFVPLIEEGIISDDIMALSIKHYLDSFINENTIDTLVLGCTHYPLIRKEIEKLYPDLTIVDPSQEIIHLINRELEINDMFAKDSTYQNTFYASDLSDNFINMINKIFADSDFRVAFKSFDIK